jgi:hypothetical protein
MKNFLAKYVIVAVIGSAAIYGAAPYMGGAASSPTVTSGALAGVRGLYDQVQIFLSAPPDAPAGEATPPSPPSAQGVETDDERRDDDAYTGPRWAVVARDNARAYSKEGKFVGRLACGTILEVVADAHSDSESFAVCGIAASANAPSEVVVRSAELDIIRGALADATERVRGLHVRRAILNAKLELAETTGIRYDNPHALEYVRQRDTYREFWRKVEDLQKKRDAGGAHHQEYADELRKMKGDDIRIGKAFEDIKHRYDAWNEKNPQRGKSAYVEAVEAEIAAIEHELSSTRAR